MQIDQIVLYHAALKLRQPFVTSLGWRDYANNIFVRIRTKEGIEGWGECSPYPLINGETVDTCFVVGKLLAEKLIGTSALEPDKASSLMDRTIYGNTSIKSALDIAIHDIAARASGQPLYQFLGGAITKKIYTDYTVSIGSIEQMVADAKVVKERGFPVMKVKLGDGGKTDIERIRAIREAVGDDIKIRVDANQGWNVTEAVSTLTALTPFDIEYCEEPISRHIYPRLKKVKRHSPVKLMADETVSDHHDAEKLIKMKLCDMINIKLGKSAGLVKAQKIIQKAERAEMPMQIGGFLESRILFTANCHLAHTSPMVQYFDFDSPLFMEEDPVIGGMVYQPDWEITLPESPGLGLSVNQEFLKGARSITIK